MSKRSWIGIGLAVVAIAAVVLLILPWFANDDLEAPVAPRFSAVAVIDDARVVLPPVAGGAAAIYFTISNRGKDTLFITKVEFANGSGTALAETGGVEPTRLSNQPIDPGETVRLEPGTGHVVLTDYDSNVVPGAVSEMTLTFQNGQTVKIPAKVEASPAAAKPARAGAEAGSPRPPGR